MEKTDVDMIAEIVRKVVNEQFVASELVPRVQREGVQVPSETGHGFSVAEIAGKWDVSYSEAVGCLRVLMKASVARQTGTRFAVKDGRRVRGKPTALYTVDESFMALFEPRTYVGNAKPH